MPHLIYVSNNALLSKEKQNPFFLQEKKWLLERFNTFDVICLRGSYICKDDNNLVCRQKMTKLRKLAGYLEGAFDPEAYKELLHMLRDKAFALRNVLKVFRFAADSARLRKLIKERIKEYGPENVVLYSYWLSYDAYAVARLKEKYPGIYAISRAHAFDVQAERNSCNPYLMKSYICKRVDKIYFISQDSLSRFQSYYKDPIRNVGVQYLGSDQENSGLVQRRKKEKLTLVSCSAIMGVKRLDRIIKAIENWNRGPIHWIHIGDGPDADIIQNLAAEKLSNNNAVSYEFMGYMENTQVHTLLRREDIDVFVNCSQIEGVPVSIMEAMSVGLPVIAPHIFGIPELVKEDSGFLFEQNEDVHGLISAIEKFENLDEAGRAEMGRCAYAHWQRDFCLQNNLRKLFTPVLDK